MLKDRWCIIIRYSLAINGTLFLWVLRTWKYFKIFKGSIDCPYNSETFHLLHKVILHWEKNILQSFCVPEICIFTWNVILLINFIVLTKVFKNIEVNFYGLKTHINWVAYLLSPNCYLHFITWKIPVFDNFFFINLYLYFICLKENFSFSDNLKPFLFVKQIK